MELLSPAGNYKAFIGAINAGCDAVYLGGTKFGARAYADNFSDEEIIKAIRTAHLYGVKVYLTVNTLIKEREFKEVCDYIRPFYEAGLDACIVQDIGLISSFGKLFPEMECHVSTQGFATGIKSVEFYKKLGASRVVLARELSLSEIKDIKHDVDIELETFIHGAMCYSYSGECLFSSCLGGRSGNRGRCAGPCRLPYKYSDENGKISEESYFLSMKDQCTINLIPSLIDAGIDSLKIEGRMKKPEYTAFVTSIYRKYIDLYINNPSEFYVEKKDIDALRHIYLRSEIGEGYYNQYNGKSMLTLSNPAYLGNDQQLMELVNKEFLEGINRIGISLYASVYSGAEITMVLTNQDIAVTVVGPVAESAQSRATTKEDITKQLSKMGDTCFTVTDSFIDTDNSSFVPVKILNELRRSCVNKLEDEIIEDKIKKYPGKFRGFNRSVSSFNKEPIVSVVLKEQFDALKDSDFKGYIAVTAELFDKYDCSYDNLLISLPDCIRNKDYNYIDKILKKSTPVKGMIVHNYEALNILVESGYKGILIAGPELYCFNCESETFINSLCDSYIYPLELSKHEIKDLNVGDSYLQIYGRAPLMRTANCVYKTNRGCNPHKGDCFIYIEDRTGAKIPVYRNCDVCMNTLYNSIPGCLFNEKINDYSHYISFTDEDYSEVNNIMMLYNKHLMPEKFTKAYFNRGVE